MRPEDHPADFSLPDKKWRFVSIEYPFHEFSLCITWNLSEFHEL